MRDFARENPFLIFAAFLLLLVLLWGLLGAPTLTGAAANGGAPTALTSPYPSAPSV